MLATAAASYLDALNPEQRRAVEHGVTADGHIGQPLLVIAGAGSGKTNTLTPCGIARPLYNFRALLPLTPGKPSNS